MNVPMILESAENQLYVETETEAATFAIHPPLAMTSKGFRDMLRSKARVAKYRKGFALWQFVRYTVVAIYIWIGGTFLFGGDRIAIEPTYHLIDNIQPGGVRGHGAILFLLALWLASKPSYRGHTVHALLAILFYSLLSTLLICGGWVVHQPDLTAPAWYVLVAALSFGLILSVDAAIRGQVRQRRGGGSRA